MGSNSLIQNRLFSMAYFRTQSLWANGGIDRVEDFDYLG